MTPFLYKYKALKELALACRSKKEGYGRMLNNNFRLWYDKDHETVNLYDRYEHKLIAKTQSNDVVVFHYPDKTYIQQYIKSMVNYMYGVRISIITGNIAIKENHEYFIERIITHADKQGKAVFTHPGKFVYIPDNTYINQNGVICASDYKASLVNKEWNKQYTLTSKRNRAAFTAMNNMVPYETKEEVIAKNQSTIAKGLNNGTYITETKYNEVKVVQLVIDTPKPTGDDIYKLRNLLQLYQKTSDLRTLLQRLFNEQRYDRAKKDDKIVTTTYKNLPR